MPHAASLWSQIKAVQVEERTATPWVYVRVQLEAESEWREVKVLDVLPHLQSCAPKRAFPSPLCL